MDDKLVLENLQVINDKLSVKDRYHSEVESRQAQIGTLKATNKFLHEIKVHTMPGGATKNGQALDQSHLDQLKEISARRDLLDARLEKQTIAKEEYDLQKTLLSQKEKALHTKHDIAQIDKKKLLDLAQKTGATGEEIEKALFGEADSDDKIGLIAECRNIWSSVLPLSKRRFLIGQKIADFFSETYKDKPELTPFTSEEKTIPIDTPKGKIKMSPKELLAQHLDGYTSRVINLRESAIQACLADPELATYEAYEWTRVVSGQVEKGNSKIFPTEYTEAVKQQIQIAHEKRNGLLKYILFGEAGVGKTKLIEANDSERGKKTVVINFHHYITFEELIGQTAIAIDLGGSTSLEKLNQAVQRFVEGNPKTEIFWQDMETVFKMLPADKRSRFTSVEDMVNQFGRGLDPTIDKQELQDSNPDRAKIQKEFQDRLKGVRDMTLLGLHSPGQENLESRYVRGVLLKIIDEGKGNIVPCFDELDKAGPYAVESLLSFLSYGQGDTWNFQGGSIKIPDNFYISATSNRSNIGAVTNSQDMNRYLADRCEQILVNPQPVKDALKIASVLISDENGNLMLNEQEQIHLINAFSYIIPRLQQYDLPMPVTNRVIRTICSRLIDFQMGSDGRKHFYRILNKAGQSQSVAEAVRLSTLRMKQMSLGQEGTEKVQKILGEYSSLLGEGKIAKFSSAFSPLFTESEGETQSVSRASVVSSIWEQPLFVAIGRMQSDLPSFGGTRLEEVDSDLLGIDKLGNTVEAVEKFDMRRLGCKNGIGFETDNNGIFMISQTSDRQEVGRKTMINGDYEGAVIVGADQVGNMIVAKKKDNSLNLIVDGHTLLLNVKNEKETVVDPLGKYFITAGDSNLTLSIPSYNAEGVFEPQKIDFGTTNGTIIDVSPDGKRIVYKDSVGLHIADLGDINEITAGHSIHTYDLVMKDWEGARFVGNSFLVGQTKDAVTPVNEDGKISVITVTT